MVSRWLGPEQFWIQIEITSFPKTNLFSGMTASLFQDDLIEHGHKYLQSISSRMAWPHLYFMDLLGLRFIMKHTIQLFFSSTNIICFFYLFCFYKDHEFYPKLAFNIACYLSQNHQHLQLNRLCDSTHE